ncbi:uncharacterized protein LALA0_S12e00188g [Lachancea lanzarotensis]|uniref:LALA0S12e00188g1_1 n=1 Tax=Lachancea lanzarotensis TaxID=1245769 RepID=A0A0C7N9E1_9SACH|nr:uncharacterized protein LALA0_S12e00188g [Lachancea lanzarotensis]CEP64499.1 LALA0S12e00188g1_1 [Lachancea lanzarotensis]
MVNFTQLAALTASAIGVRAGFANSTTPQISDLKIADMDTGTSDIVGTYDTAFVELTVKATELGACWFQLPPNYVTYPQDTPYNWDYGIVNNYGDNNITIDITKVPESGEAKFGIEVYFTTEVQNAIQKPGKDSVVVETSNGSMSIDLNYIDVPLYEPSVHTDLTQSRIIYDVYVPASMITSNTSVTAHSFDGRKFDSSLCAVYDVTQAKTFDPYEDLNLVSPDFEPYSWDGFSNESDIYFPYRTTPIVGAKWVMFKFFADVPEGLQYYTQDITVNIDGEETTITTHTYSKYYPRHIEEPDYKFGGASDMGNGNSITSYSESTTAVATASLSSASSNGTAVFTGATTATGFSNGTVTMTGSASSTASAAGQASASASGQASTSASGQSSASASGQASASGFVNGTTSVTGTGSATTTTANILSTTVITTCPTCEVKATTVGVSTATVTKNGIVTAYTTYCPLSAETGAHTVSQGTTYAPSVVISEVESGIYTAYTTYCPYPENKSAAQATTTACVSCGNQTASVSGSYSAAAAATKAASLSVYEGGVAAVKGGLAAAVLGAAAVLF